MPYPPRAPDGTPFAGSTPFPLPKKQPMDFPPAAGQEELCQHPIAAKQDQGDLSEPPREESGCKPACKHALSCGPPHPSMGEVDGPAPLVG